MSRSIERCCEADTRHDLSEHVHEVHVAFGRVLVELSGVIDEMLRCAEAIESAVGVHAGRPLGCDVWLSDRPDEGYPELLAVDLPAQHAASGTPGCEDPSAVAARSRALVGAVKDRYTTLLPGLRWTGHERDDFSGRRLTALRAALEVVEDDLGSIRGALQDSSAAFRAG